MGRDGNAVATARQPGALPGYELLEGEVPVLHAPRLAERAREIQGYLMLGSGGLSEILAVEPPDFTASLVADGDWGAAPRETVRPYPPGLPYFTRSVSPPVIALPERLSPVFRPRTEATYPLAVWHELGHAFLLRREEVVRTPAWLGELLPQLAAAAIARRAGVLDGHLALLDRTPGFTVRTLRQHATADEQMAFQNLLLLLGAAALSEFGEGCVGRMFHALWEEDEVVGEERAEEMFAEALGEGGGGWLRSRPEF